MQTRDYNIIFLLLSLNTELDYADVLIQIKVRTIRLTSHPWTPCPGVPCPSTPTHSWSCPSQRPRPPSVRPC